MNFVYDRLAADKNKIAESGWYSILRISKILKSKMTWYRAK